MEIQNELEKKLRAFMRFLGIKFERIGEDIKFEAAEIKENEDSNMIKTIKYHM